MFVERDWKTMSGRWFTGAYDETGIDVKLDAPRQRSGRVRHERRGAEDRVRPAQALRIFGANLPGQRQAGRHRARPGRQGHAHRQRAPDEIAVEVDVAADAPIGARDVSVAGAVKPAALVVYDKIDGIKVLPQAGMARVGGDVFPKQLQQFEAVGINNGPDGKPDTADDLNLGLVDRQVVGRGIHRDVRRRRHAVRRHDRRRTGCSRRTSTVRTRSAAATATTSATCGSSPSCDAERADGAGRCARARTCW